MTWLNLVELSKLWQFSDILDQVQNTHMHNLIIFVHIFYTVLRGFTLNIFVLEIAVLICPEFPPH